MGERLLRRMWMEEVGNGQWAVFTFSDDLPDLVERDYDAGKQEVFRGASEEEAQAYMGEVTQMMVGSSRVHRRRVGSAEKEVDGVEVEKRVLN